MTNDIKIDKIGSNDDFLTLNKIDQLIKDKNVNFTYTLSDVILFLLYANRKPIRGKTKQQKEVFLALELVLNKLQIQPIHFKEHNFGPYSEEVDNTIDQLVFSNNLLVTGKKISKDFTIEISHNGMKRIKDKFDGLPDDIKKDLALKREQWDTHTHSGILNVVYTHFQKYRERSVLKKRYEKLDWDNDKQVPIKNDN